MDVGGNKVGLNSKKAALRESLHSNGTVLDLECGGGYINPYMGSNCIELRMCAHTYTHNEFI